MTRWKSKRPVCEESRGTDSGVALPRQTVSSPQVRRFFKVMLGEGFPAVMYLPPAFARRAMHLCGQKVIVEDSSGRQWDVKLRAVDGSLAFDKGWHKFVLDHDVKEGEILVFNYYIKKNHFVVQIFGTSGCERIGFSSQGNGMPMIELETLSDTDMVHDLTPHLEEAEGSFRAKRARRGNMADMQFEDPVCMMESNMPTETQDRRFLLDMSAFEMENETESMALMNFEKINIHVPEIFICENELPSAAKTLCAFSGTSVEYTVNIEGAETAPSTQSCSFSDEVCSEKFEKAVDLKASSGLVVEQYETEDKTVDLEDPSVLVVEQYETKDKDSTFQPGVILECSTMEDIVREKDLVQDNANVGSHTMLQPQLESHEMVDRKGKNHVDHSFKSFASMEKELHAEATEQNNKNVSRRQMASKFSGVNEVPNFVNEKLEKKPGGSACKGFQMLNNGPSQTPVIKKELGNTELPYGVSKVAENAGLKPTTEKKQHQVFSPIVKTEPRVASSPDVDPFASCANFSAEVKSQTFLATCIGSYINDDDGDGGMQELPLTVIGARKQERGGSQGKVMYLRDSARRVWPFLLVGFFSAKALIFSWKNFCIANCIKRGDICHFRRVDDCIFSVEISQTSPSH